VVWRWKVRERRSTSSAPRWVRKETSGNLTSSKYKVILSQCAAYQTRTY
jgi:hypothetical protein